MKKIFLFFSVLFTLMLSIESIYGQPNADLQTADSFYQNKNWTVAKQKYLRYLGDDSLNSLVWNRLGYCNQNLGNYTDAISNYNRSLKLNPLPRLRVVHNAACHGLFDVK